MSMTNDIFEFHKKFGINYTGTPRQLPDDLLDFRIKFLQEELNEFVADCHKNDLAGQLDALVDLVYVALGTAHLMGVGEEVFDEAWRRVHNANMKKVKSEGNGRHSSDIVKPAGWVAPSLDDLV